MFAYLQQIATLILSLLLACLSSFTVLTVILAIGASLYLWLQSTALTAFFTSQIRDDTATRPKNIILFTAHPDDEVMFFAPTIHSFNKDNIHVVCFSNGNYNGLGKVRQVELTKCCDLLGVKKVVCLDLDEFPDNSAKSWDPSKIALKMEHYINQYKADVVITFDSRGVSGHLNHRSLNTGLRYYLKTKSKKYLLAYTLTSVPLLRKYISFLDIIYTFLPVLYRVIMATMDLTRKETSQLVLVSTLDHLKKSRTAMMCHRSQMVWFRWLYILFSRYMIINDLVLQSEVDEKNV